MLRRLKVKGYKSLYDVDVALPPLAVLIGPNSSGKSNLLDVLQLLARSASGLALEEAFDLPHRGVPIESFSFPEGGLAEQAGMDRLALSIEADLRLSDAVVDSVDCEIRRYCPPGRKKGRAASNIRDRDLRYRIEIEMFPKSGEVRVSDEHLVALNPAGKPKRGRKSFIEKQGDKIMVANEGQDPPAHFECDLDRTALSAQPYVSHHPHSVAVRKELERWQFFCFEPRKHMRDPNPLRAAHRIGRLGEDLAAFYRTMRATNPRQFRQKNFAMNLLLPWADEIDLHVNPRGEIDLRIRENGCTIPASVLSEGTLRMLGLLALAGGKTIPALVGLEEPETGIHPGRMDMIGDLLINRTNRGDTQYIVTTHSSVLADRIPHDSLFFVRRNEGRTDVSPFADWGPVFKMRSTGEGRASPRGGLPSSSLPVSERILRGDFDA